MLSRTTPINRNTVCGLIAILIWGTTVALARSLSEKVGPLTAAAAVYLIGGVFSLGWMACSRGSFQDVRVQSCRYLFGCGALFVVYMISLYMAIGLAGNRYQVLEIGLINYLWPTFTILFSLFILKKKVRLLFVPATLLALVGVFFAVTQGSSFSWNSFAQNIGSNPWAYALALVAAVSWGLYSNLTRRLAEPGSGGAVQLFIPITGVVLLLILPFHHEVRSWSLQAGLEILFVSLATTFAYVFWDSGMRKGDVILLGSSSYFTPLLSTVVSCLYLGVAADARLWLGCVLIVTGSLMSWLAVSEGPVDRDT